MKLVLYSIWDSSTSYIGVKIDGGEPEAKAYVENLSLGDWVELVGGGQLLINETVLKNYTITIV